MLCHICLLNFRVNRRLFKNSISIFIQLCFSNVVIAAFMPAYGPFMMVRFCAAIGIGGCMPVAACYLCEITPLSSRARYV